jgi:hypothetical protein
MVALFLAQAAGYFQENNLRGKRIGRAALILGRVPRNFWGEEEGRGLNFREP